MNRALLPAWQLPEPDIRISKEVAATQKPYDCPAFPKVLTCSSRLIEVLPVFIRLIVIILLKKITMALLTELMLIFLEITQVKMFN